MGSSLSLVESTLELPHLPGSTQLSLMILINQRFDSSSRDLGRRLHRDPSMVSRLYADYVAQRAGSLEKQVQAILKT